MSDISSDKKSERTLIVIAGATASGKTDAGISLAKKLNTEIISADARQFYREMNIGTAKPTTAQLAEVKHHFINSLSIHDDYSAGKFEADVELLMNKLWKKYSTLIMVGGSGLFIDAAINGLDEIPKVNADAKQKVKALFDKNGIEALQSELKKLDEAYYTEADTENPHRMIRALEVCYTTGKPFSSFRKKNKKQINFKVKYFVLDVEREELYNRINHRVDDMMNQGLEEEAKSLLQFRNLNSLNTVGYKELFEYFDGKYSLQEAVEKIKQHTRNYAKRQLTWFRGVEEAKWITHENLCRLFNL